MEMNQIVEKFSKHRVIPVIAIENKVDALPLADALLAGDLPLIEITFRTSVASDVIAELHKKRPEILLGAGTILKIEELKKAMDNGATFAVAPGFNPEIVAEALKNNFPFMPGIMTPSDLEGALSLGLQYFKFFPAEAAGGVKYLSSISAPYSHRQIKFVPTGGINLSNLTDYLSLESVLAVGGTWIAKSHDINAGAWETIASNCREVRKIVDK
jgi:2-dehydro-3-deoxyphosphogluconate aldolase/(4S)-4-hydroxy-2-oxoglutarate aldolase